MKRLVFLLLALGAMAMAVPADARRHASSHRGHAGAHAGHHHGGAHARGRHGGRGHGRHSRGRHHARGAAVAEEAAPSVPAISQDDAQALALRDSPGTITNVTKTVRGRDTYYTVDIRGAEGQRRVLVDATHGKVMASIPVAQ